MKRSDMVTIIMNAVNERIVDLYSHWDNGDAIVLLDILEKSGMRPPRVSEEDAQAIMSVYCGGNFNQWDEDVILDTKVQETKARRAAAAIERSTPEGRAAMRKRRNSKGYDTSTWVKLPSMKGKQDDTV